ncbi:hypothetical protein Y10_18090 [Neptunitalea sp. Y10]|uniref:N-acetyltransferase domain-containing protein n=2 Tax=Neptunitalea lumnitzerae TaxID=2965509 RepID=A0ABQ5MJ47_9FLAO|nr:hypothetical protein Y10_18090 [Neptunitalea sp. Y10]
MQMITIKEVTTIDEIQIIKKLAHEIFHEIYTPIVNPDYVDYFIQKYQTADTIQTQIKKEHFRYFLLQFNDQNTGYLGVQLVKEKLILSKLYVLQSFRGLKIGKLALEYVYQLASAHRIPTIELMVNQQNKNSLAIYLKNGFQIIDSIVTFSPNGDSSEEYKMQKSI